MAEEQSQMGIPSVVRTTQVIVVALCLGIVTFGVFLVVTGEDGKEAEADMLIPTLHISLVRWPFQGRRLRRETAIVILQRDLT